MKIVVLDSFPLDTGDINWDAIKKLGELILYENTKPEELAARVADADIILTNKAPIKADSVKDLKKCKLIGVLATGANILDLPALQAAGIKVANVPGYGVEDVAQQALALLMELARKTYLHSESVKAGDWPKKGWCYWLSPPLCLAGLTLGIIGFGAIGQMMGKYGNALGMNVLAWSRSRKAKADYSFNYAGLDEIFRLADVISLHCPLSPGTERMINRESIAKMKQGTIIINTARGALVDEYACAEALISGQLAGLGTDVLSHEPPGADNPLLSAPNTLITPHMAWATKRARQKIVEIMAENIRGFINGNPQNVLI